MLVDDSGAGTCEHLMVYKSNVHSCRTCRWGFLRSHSAFSASKGWCQHN